MFISIAAIQTNSKITLLNSIILYTLLIFIAGCSDIEATSNEDIQLKLLIENNNLSVEPLGNLQVPDIASPIANWGKLCFTVNHLAERRIALV